jgi:methylthioxylose transferase
LADVTYLTNHRVTFLTLIAWAGLIVACHAWGLTYDNVAIKLEAPPLYGEFITRLDAGVLWALATAAVVLAGAPLVVRHASWRVLLLAVGVVGLAWPLSLTMIEGTEEISDPLLVSTQYLLAVPQVESPGAFLDGFVQNIDDYPAHVRAHPPGMVLGLWGLDQVGLGGEWAAAFAILIAAATAAPAVLITMRALAGEEAARRAAPYLVLAPLALSIATTADALFMAVGAWAVCAVVLAILSSGTRSNFLALVGGLLFGLTIFLNYGLVLLALVPLFVSLRERRLMPIAVASAGGLVVVIAFLAAGFWWLDGLAATRREYSQSVASVRPYEFFVFNNLAASALVLGPVAIVGLARLRDRAIWVLVGGALAAILVADLSGLSKAEVERIWLPFLIWMLLATAALPSSPRWMRSLLATQAVLTILIGVHVEQIW